MEDMHDDEFNSRYLNRVEAARLCRISTRTLDLAIRAGELQVCRPGRRRVIVDRVELERWLHRGAAACSQ